MNIEQLNKINNSVSIPQAQNIHIGIEHFYSQPVISVTESNTNRLFKIWINNIEHVINANDILEFEEFKDVSEISVSPTIGSWDNNTFITIAYNTITAVTSGS